MSHVARDDDQRGADGGPHEGRAARPRAGDPVPFGSRGPGVRPTPRPVSRRRRAELPLPVLVPRRCTATTAVPLYAYASAGGWEFGGDIEFPVKKYSGAPVVTRTPIQNEDDVHTLKVARRHHQGRCPAHRPGHRPPAGRARHAGDPADRLRRLTWAGSVIGEERMMNWLIKKPDLVHVVLDKVSTFLIKVAEHYVEEFGAEQSDGLPRRRHRDQQADLPQAVRDLRAALPAAHQLTADRVGCRTHFMHICGEQNKNLPSGSRCP